MPIQDIDTRWNATYEMIERQISTRDVMEILVSAHTDVLENLYPTDTKWAKILVYIFKFLFLIFKNMQDDHYALFN